MVTNNKIDIGVMFISFRLSGAHFAHGGADDQSEIQAEPKAEREGRHCRAPGSGSIQADTKRCCRSSSASV
jgi:hypothetical protein